MKFTRTNLYRPIDQPEIAGIRTFTMNDELLAFHQVFSPVAIKKTTLNLDIWQDSTIGATERFAGLQRLGNGFLFLDYAGVFLNDSTIFFDPTWENYFYYVSGNLVVFQTRATASRILSCPWDGDSRGEIQEAQCSVSIISRPGSIPFAFGEYKDEVVIATNNGQLLRIKDGLMTTIFESPRDVSWQGYGMLQWNDKLLIGHYPTGNVFVYDGTNVEPFEPAIPNPPGNQQKYREAQTLSIYGGELYVGSWPWGELWRFSETRNTWDYIGRFFDSDDQNNKSGLEPFASEMEALYPDLTYNIWGQRIESLSNFGDGLAIATFNKGGTWPLEQEPSFMSPDIRNQYGAVTLLRGVPQVTCQIQWRAETMFSFRVKDQKYLEILQDGEQLCLVEADLSAFFYTMTEELITGAGAYGQTSAVISVE